MKTILSTRVCLRKALLCALLIPMLLQGSCTTTWAQRSGITLDVVQNDFTPGGALVVEVKIDAEGLIANDNIPSNTLSSATIDVDYDGSSLTYVGATGGVITSSQGYSVNYNALVGDPATGEGEGAYVRLTILGLDIGPTGADGYDVPEELVTIGTLEFQIASGNGVGSTGLFVRRGSVSLYYYDTPSNDDGDYGAMPVAVTPIQDAGDPALPVEMRGFTVDVSEQTALLAWSTASETNNAGFEVERRFDQGPFESAGFVEGKGTTSEAHTYEFRVEALDPGRHAFRMKQLDFDGAITYSPEVEVDVEMAGPYALEPAYPNPFNPTATIRFAVREAERVDVVVYNVLGEQVQTLYHGTPAAGRMQALRIDGTRLSSGLYFVRLEGETFEATQKVSLVK